MLMDDKSHVDDLLLTGIDSAPVPSSATPVNWPLALIGPAPIIHIHHRFLPTIRCRINFYCVHSFQVCHMSIHACRAQYVPQHSAEQQTKWNSRSMVVIPFRMVRPAQNLGVNLASALRPPNLLLRVFLPGRYPSR